MLKIKNFIYLFLVYFILIMCFSFIFFSFFGETQKDILNIYISDWNIYKSLIFFISNFQVFFSIFLLLIIYYIYENPKLSSFIKKLKKNNQVNKVFILIIFFTGFAVFLNEFLLPVFYEKQDFYLKSSITANKARAQADIFLKNNDYIKAEKALNIYRNIDKKDLKAIEELETIKAKMAIKKNADKEAQVTAIQSAKPMASYPELLEIARKYYDAEDYSSAIYFASLASKISGNSKEADALIKSAENNISNMEKTISEKDFNLLFDRKTFSKELINRNDFIKAYYHLIETNRKYPRDRETINLLAKVKESLEEIAFFKTEIEEYELAPAFDSNYFVNDTAENLLEVIRYDKLAYINNSQYFKDIEILRIQNGKNIFHIKSPYGKLVNNKILLNCLDPVNSRNSYYPEKINKSGGDLNYITMNRELDIIRIVNPDKSFDKFPLNTLISAYLFSKAYGFSDIPAALEIIMHFVKIFSYYTFFSLSIILGIILKKTRRDFHFFKGIILIISLFFIINFANNIYLYFNKLLFSFILIYNDIYMGILFLLFLNAIVIFSINAVSFRVIK